MATAWETSHRDSIGHGRTPPRRPRACLPTLGDGGDKRCRASCTPTIQPRAAVGLSATASTGLLFLPAVETCHVAVLFDPLVPPCQCRREVGRTTDTIAANAVFVFGSEPVTPPLVATPRCYTQVDGKNREGRLRPLSAVGGSGPTFTSCPYPHLRGQVGVSSGVT